jgi:putative transcriptional regulator
MTQRGNVLEDSWYMDYAAGTLATQGQQVILASHVELSDDARDRVAMLDRIGGAVLGGASGGAAPAFSADDIFALDEEAAAAEPLQSANDRDPSLCLPRALTQWLDTTGTRVRWSFLGPGMSKAVLWQGEHGEKLWLLKAQPGMAIPHHGHRGREWTLVLKGSFWDGDQQYAAGDLEAADADVEHDIRIDEGGECICLALTEGKLRFESPLLRAFQVFTGL